MTKKRYLTNDIVEFDYSEIWEKSDNEMYTDRPLRNDEIVRLLNKQYEDICFKIEIINKLQEAIGILKEENKQLKKENKELEDFRYYVFDSINKTNQEKDCRL